MNHKNLDAWKHAMDVVDTIYSLTESFPKHELFGLVSQMRRSAVSIPSNIAEGAARNSDKEFIQFLYISLGSSAELETQIIISERRSYISLIQMNEINRRIQKVDQIILGLIKHLKSKAKK